MLTNKSHFSEILNKSEGAPYKFVSSNKLTTLWAGYGQIYHLIVKTEENRSKNLIIKEVKPKPDSGISHERKVKSYEVEASFYETIAPQLESNTHVIIPHPIYVEENLSNKVDNNDPQRNGRMILIMNDLRDAYPNRSGPLDLAHSKAALTWLANFHASHWKKELPTTLWNEASFWQLETRLEELQQTEYEWEALKKSAHSIHNKLSRSKFRTIVHGDAKAANFLFSNSSTAPVAAAYDFQYVGNGDGMRDVAYLMASSVQGRIIEQQEEGLLQHYHSELTALLSKEHAEEYTFDVMQEQFELALTDFVRFMAGWGWWGNTKWASMRARKYLGRHAVP